MQSLKIALLQVDLFWENKAKNLALFEQKINDLTEEVDIIVLPEMFTTGFSMQPQKLAEEMQGQSFMWMQKMAEKHNVAITGSLIIKQEEEFVNRLVWMQPDGKWYTYDKKHLFSMAGEDKVYKPGSFKLVLDYKGWKICPMVCYDLRFPVWIRNTENYDLLIFVANWPDRRVKHWQLLLQARAIENQCFTIGVNRVGDDGNQIYHSGHSMAINPQGNVLWQEAEKDATGIVTLNYEEITATRRYMPFLKDKDNFEFK